MSMRAGYMYPFLGVGYICQHPRDTVGQMVMPLFLGTVGSVSFAGLYASMVPQASRFIAEATLSDSWVDQTLNAGAQVALVAGGFLGVLTIARVATAVGRHRVYKKVLKIAPEASDKSETLIQAAWRSLKWFAFRVGVATLSSPLNVVPLLGTCAYLFVNGLVYSWELSERYLVHRGLKEAREQWDFVSNNMNTFGSFGASCLLLETLLPMISPIVTVTNTVGAALWAKDLDSALQKRAKTE